MGVSYHYSSNSSPSLLDTAVPVLAAGADSELRSACQRLLELGAAGGIELSASTEMIQEFVFHRLRRTGDRLKAVAEGEHLMGFVVTVPFDNSMLRRSLSLIRSVPSIRGRDGADHGARMDYQPRPGLRRHPRPGPLRPR
jgi:hypothetical protein